MIGGGYLFSLCLLIVGVGLVGGAIVFRFRIPCHWWGILLLWGGAFLFLGVWQARFVYHTQPLSSDSVKEALGISPCVAGRIRDQLDEAEQPITRNGLSDIEDDCERQVEKKAELEAVQAVLEQQRQAARQPEAEIGKE